MKKILFGALILLASPALVSAQVADRGDAGQFGDLIVNFVEVINNLLIPFIIALGFLVFVWGIFLYFIAGGADEEKRAKGRSLTVNAIFGFVMIIIFWGVVNLITTSLGLEGESLESIPTVLVP